MARRRPSRSFARRYAPLLLAGVAVLVMLGLRTDDRIGVDLGGQLEQRAADQTGGATSTTEAGTRSTATLPSSTTRVTVDESDAEGVPASLRQALLTDGDLPDEWAPSTEGDRSTEVCPGQDPAGEVEPDSALKASFAAGETGPYVTSVVADFGGGGDAKDYLDALADAVDACASYEDEATSTSYRVERTRDSDLGDQSVTASVTITGSRLGDVTGRVLAVRVDDRVVTVAFYSVGDADASIAVEALETVVARLEAG